MTDLKNEIEGIIQNNGLYQMASDDGLPINVDYKALVEALTSLIQQEREKAVMDLVALLSVGKSGAEIGITRLIAEQFIKESGGNERD